MKAAKGEAQAEAGEEASDIPFWEQKPLEAMNAAEWESLCDGCGRCCLVKLEDEDTGSFHFTAVACRLFDADRCTCRDYPHRTERVPDCVKLDVDAVRSFGWLPVTCAYRLIAEGRGLYWWHPLVSGDPASVREAGISAHGKIAAFEDDVSPEELPGFIVTWPNRLPARAARRRAKR